MIPPSPHPRSPLDPDVLSDIEGLELRAQLVVDGYYAGQHRSPYQGHSVEYSQHRDYVPGDDLRYLDWKVYGKSDKLYLKQFEEETNLICYLLLDASESMGVQSETAAMSKLQYAQTILAALVHLILHQRDSVGLVTFDDVVREYVPPSSSPSQLAEILQRLATAQPQNSTCTGPIFHELAERFRHRGLVVIVSDLLDDESTMLSGLRHFAYKRHDLVVFHVLDPAEVDFPFHRPTLFRGLETQPDVHLEPRRMRRAYQQEFQAYANSVRAGCRSQRADYLLVRTDQSLGAVLGHFLAARMKRLRCAH